MSAIINMIVGSKNAGEPAAQPVAVDSSTATVATPLPAETSSAALPELAADPALLTAAIEECCNRTTMPVDSGSASESSASDTDTDGDGELPRLVQPATQTPSTGSVVSSSEARPQTVFSAESMLAFMQQSQAAQTAIQSQMLSVMATQSQLLQRLASNKTSDKSDGVTKYKTLKVLSEAIGESTGGPPKNVSDTTIANRVTRIWLAYQATGALINLSEAVGDSQAHQGDLPAYRAFDDAQNVAAYQQLASTLINKTNVQAIMPYKTPSIANLNPLEILSLMSITIERHFEQYVAIENLASAFKLPVPNRVPEALASLTAGQRSMLTTAVNGAAATSYKTTAMSGIQSFDSSASGLSSCIGSVTMIRDLFKTQLGVTGSAHVALTFLLQPGERTGGDKIFLQNYVSADMDIVNARFKAWCAAVYKDGNDSGPKIELEQRSHSRNSGGASRSGGGANGGGGAQPAQPAPAALKSGNKQRKHEGEKKTVHAAWVQINGAYDSVERARGALIVCDDAPGADFFGSSKEACEWASKHPHFSYPESWGKAFGSELHSAFKSARKNVSRG